ncbi:MAG: D-aminoacyl-tRNA deacylase [Pseudomonadota bacterium]
MIGLLQRVTQAEVTIEEESVGAIGAGLLVLVGFQRGDQAERLPRFLERLLNFRVFSDEQGRMNRSLRDEEGGLLLVPQFTLAADTNSGNRPSFTPAADPETGQRLFDEFLALSISTYSPVEAGRFGADMQVALVNDGPVTFWIEVN